MDDIILLTKPLRKKGNEITGWKRETEKENHVQRDRKSGDYGPMGV